MECQSANKAPAGPAGFADSDRFHLTPPAPFSFALTAGHQTFFRGRTGADYFESGIYRRVLEWGDRRHLIAVGQVAPAVVGADRAPTEPDDPPDLWVEVASPGGGPPPAAWVTAQVRTIFAFEADFRAFDHLAATDPLVARLRAVLPGLRPAQTPSVFEALVQAIIGQQIAGRLAHTIRDLVVDTLGEPFVYAGRVYRAYPRPASLAAASIAELRGLKLSQRKAAVLREIAGRVATGDLNLESLRALANADVVARLVACRGVGRWTAEWVLLRALGRTDAFPVGDLVIRRVLADFYQAGQPLTDRQTAAIAAGWGAAAGIVTAYLFAAVRQGIDLGALATADS